MVEQAAIIALIGALGIGAQWIAWRTGWPAIVLIIAAGVLAGPITGLLAPRETFGELLEPQIAMSVALMQPANAPSPGTDETASDEPRSILQPDVLAGKAAQPTLERADATKPFPDLGTALSEDARAQLDELLKAPIVEAGGPIVLRGHTDSQGYDGDNLVVSRRRAEAVARYLEQGGVAPERISIIALGEARPVAPNAMPDGSDDPDGRARNRHVEVEILPPAERRLGRRRPPILNRFSRVIDTPRRSVIFLLN